MSSGPPGGYGTTKRIGLAWPQASPTAPSRAEPIVPRTPRRFKELSAGGPRPGLHRTPKSQQRRRSLRPACARSELRLRCAVVVARLAAHLEAPERAIVDVSHIAFERGALPVDRDAHRLQLAQDRTPHDERASHPVVIGSTGGHRRAKDHRIEGGRDVELHLVADRQYVGALDER